MRKVHALLLAGCIQALLLISIMLGSTMPAAAQIVVPAEVDTARLEPLEHEPPRMQESPEMDQFEELDSLSGINPAKAAFYSAVLPGLGQAYNNSHWKIPVIYIGGAFVAYSVNFYNQLYSQYLRNLQIIALDPDVTQIDGRNLDQYDRAAAAARRQRDYTIIIGGLLYGLNIVDAYVEAHLKEFDLNDDLAMRVKPAFLPQGGGQPGAGIALTLHFK